AEPTGRSTSGGRPEATLISSTVASLRCSPFCSPPALVTCRPCNDPRSLFWIRVVALASAFCPASAAPQVPVRRTLHGQKCILALRFSTVRARLHPWQRLYPRCSHRFGDDDAWRCCVSASCLRSSSCCTAGLAP